MFFQYGYFKPLVVRKVRGVLTARQLAPGLFMATLVLAALLAPWLGVARWLFTVALGGYAAAALFAAGAIARRTGWRVGLAARAGSPRARGRQSLHRKRREPGAGARPNRVPARRFAGRSRVPPRGARRRPGVSRRGAAQRAPLPRGSLDLTRLQRERDHAPAD